MNMPLNSSRPALSPDHTATQMQEQSAPAEESTPTPPVQPLRRTARAARRPLSLIRTTTPPPTDTPAPRRNFNRRDAVATILYRPDDTRRHGMILEDASPTPPSDLPSYSALPPPPSQRLTNTTPSPLADASALCIRTSRQLELRALQRQWHRRRRAHAAASLERTHFRAEVSETYDLPPPYAPHDPYPLFQRADSRPSLWARVVLSPFVPEGELREKAACATDRVAAKVAFGVRKGVEVVSRTARAVPGKIERNRAERKVRSLEGRGYVDVGLGRGWEADGEGRVECAAFEGAWHVVDG